MTRKELGVERLRGIAAAPGVVVGRAIVLGSVRQTLARRFVDDAEVPRELERFQAALARAQDELSDVAGRAERALAGSVEGGSPSSARPRGRALQISASILEAYAAMLADPMLAEAVEDEIKDEQRCAEWAVAAAIEELAGRLADAKDPYLRERSHDVELVGDRILRAFAEEGGESVPPPPNGPTILVARDLSPADTAAMLNGPVVGFATEIGTRTSHTAIMARALKVPAVVGANDLLRHVSTGDTVILDGLRGEVVVRPTPADITSAETRAARHVALARELRGVPASEAATADGARVTLRANVELPEEAEEAYELGAQGIGLYRTEFLYIDRTSLPTEEEQFVVYRHVVEAMRGRPVVLRTFDIGGDKFASSFRVPQEMNPMLGLRAVRLAMARPDVFRDQLRAMVRASAFGDVRIMVPMVASLTELRQVRAILKEVTAEVRATGLDVPDVPLGVMIEVPSAAILIDRFAPEAAFLSLGTNDLVQYALAVDRGNRTLAYLASPFDPAIVRLIAQVVRAGAAHLRAVSVCGAMASDPLAAVLLVGLGVRELSMEAAALPAIRESLRRVTLAEAETIAEMALAADTAEEVESAIAERIAPLLVDLLVGEVDELAPNAPEERSDPPDRVFT